MTRVLKNPTVQWTLALLITGVTILCIFTPDVFLFKRSANFTVQIMIGFLLFGMLLFVLGHRRLVFIALGACGILALYLKSLTDQNLVFPVVNGDANVSVAHVDLSLSDDFSTTLLSLRNSDVDIISLQEYTPYWDAYLPDTLTERYPYMATLKRIDPYGMAVFSKYPICGIDTIFFEGFEDLPSLSVKVSLEDNTELNLVSSHTIPPMNDQAYDRIRVYFDLIAAYVRNLDGPVITLGDYSLPSWSEEIKSFKRLASLQDSRRDIVPREPGGQIFLFNIPIDHIFYSDEIECTAFNVITSENTSHLGIKGSYQLKTTLASLAPSGD